jgi:hypothetical protein
MKAAPLLLLLLTVAGCGRAADFEGPAPEGALQCTLAYAEDAGYQLVEGGVEEGFLRLVQRVNPEPTNPTPAQPAPALQDPTPERGERLTENELLVQVTDGRLHLSVVGAADVDTPTLSGSTATDQARTMLAMCTSSPPVFPPVS